MKSPVPYPWEGGGGVRREYLGACQKRRRCWGELAKEEIIDPCPMFHRTRIVYVGLTSAPRVRVRGCCVWSATYRATSPCLR